MVASVVVISATGCSSGDTDEPDALRGVGDGSSTSTPSPSEDAPGGENLPDGVPTDAPEEPTGLENDDAGAKAYGEYVFEAFNFYAQRSDPSGIRSLGRCPGCESSIKATKKSAAEGTYEVFDDDLDVRRVDVTDQVGDVTVLGLSYDQPSGRRINEDGKVLDTFGSSAKKYVTIGVKWRGGQWILDEYAITG